MCYGYDGQGALRRSLEQTGHQSGQWVGEQAGMDRRGMLRGSLAAIAAVGFAGFGSATPAYATTQATGRQQVPPGLMSIQLWTMRHDLWGSPGYDATLSRLADIGYPKVELALGYFGRTAAELRAFLDGIGIEASSGHEGLSSDAAALEKKIENARTLGQSFMVVPWLNSNSADDWKRWAERMNVEAAAAAAGGLRYGYHNHAHEFTIDLGGGRRPWDVLTEELDPRLVHLEIDIYWAVTGGINSGDGVDDPEGFVLDVIRSAPQKVLQYHVKDRHAEDGDMADLGTGMVDFARVFAGHSVLEYIVENDTPDVTAQQTAEVGYDYLRQIEF